MWKVYVLLPLCVEEGAVRKDDVGDMRICVDHILAHCPINSPSPVYSGEIVVKFAMTSEQCDLVLESCGIGSQRVKALPYPAL